MNSFLKPRFQGIHNPLVVPTRADYPCKEATGVKALRSAIGSLATRFWAMAHNQLNVYNGFLTDCNQDLLRSSLFVGVLEKHQIPMDFVLLPVRWKKLPRRVLEALCDWAWRPVAVWQFLGGEEHFKEKAREAAMKPCWAQVTLGLLGLTWIDIWTTALMTDLQ